ncbi:TetR/AcrR family transcriptional regulator [Alkalibacter rhizosphaerae]|uniref:TetR/AcrR family transcriptional regulator n=1 Tax=Alkalibacter rhizosphaerae TaxID=2815577 RepID=A0A975AI41_9FIRM|nr:TetR/AcrR family transcriptional regulator [Alkalibacter rhizosphaerae]QSX08140.1 TetR/AcrR family transcriptional regulator [Alkalibacter rhizosphaerae]
MAKTSQGIETKRLLLKSSSKLFCKYGYNKTKMQLIADNTGITIGSIGYYFRKKEDIAGELLKRYISKIYRFILQHSDGPIDSFTLHVTASLPYYKNIYKNKATRKFYYELITSGSLHSDVNSNNSFRKMMDNLNRKIIKENGVVLDDFRKTAVTIFNSGGRNAMILKLMENYFDVDEIDEAINYIGVGTGSVLGVPQDKIGIAIDYCNSFYKIHQQELDGFCVLEKY